MPSFDIKIAGKGYMFVANPGIQLGAAISEPGQPNEVGSVVITTMHGGVGRSMENGILRYQEGRDIDATIPGEILPRYSVGTVGSFTATGAVLARPSFGFTPSEEGNRVFVIGGVKIQWFNPEIGELAPSLVDLTLAASATLVSAMGANKEFSGSSFAMGGSSAANDSQQVFGVIGNNAGHLWEPNAHFWAHPGSGDAAMGTEKIAYGASGRNRAFWTTIDGTPTPVIGLRWAPFEPTKTVDTSTKFPASGVISLGQPHMSWLGMIGKSLVLFRSDGVIVGGDETGILSVAGTTTQTGIDPHFGRRAALYQDGVLIPGRNGLWSFDMMSLTLRPAGPNFVQNAAENRMRGEVCAVGSAGAYAFIALRRSVDDVVTSRGYMYIKYANLIAVHDLIPETASGDVITDFLPYYDRSTGHTTLFYIVFNENTLLTTVKMLPLVLPTDQTVSTGLGITTSAEMDLSQIDGPSPAANMTKLWLQVRGRWLQGSGSASLKFENFELDGAPVSIADVTTPGTFSMPITVAAGNEADLVARSLTQGTLTMHNPSHDTVLPLPMIFDYVWVPDTQDRATFFVLAGDEVHSNDEGFWQRNSFDTLQTLQALRNTVVTIEFPNKDSWSVLVEQVESKELNTTSGDGKSDYGVQVQVRRLV